jgi:hypothetical protein
MKKTCLPFVVALILGSASGTSAFAQGEAKVLKYGRTTIRVEGSMQKPGEFFKVSGDSVFAVFPASYAKGQKREVADIKYILTVLTPRESSEPSTSMHQYSAADLRGNVVFLCSSKEKNNVNVKL